MKLTDLAKKPTLIKVAIDDEETIAQYGEPIEFWCFDRQPLPAFLKMADNKDKNLSGVVEIVRTMILNEDGSPIITDEVTLPPDILVKVVGKMVELLGK
jgi:hypothetical protein